jgi:hypothetical protein
MRGARPKEAPSRSLGERIVGAFMGALMGLPLGAAAAGAIYLWHPGSGVQLHVLWATVAYCAVYGLIFGEALGDVLTIFYRIHRATRGVWVGGVHVRGVPYVDTDPDTEWARPLLMFFVFVVPWAGVLFMVAK